MALFVGGGAGFLAWGQRVDGPTFLFPLGRVDAATAATYLSIVGLAALAYAGVLAFVRHVRRPVVVLAEDEVSIPMGEFGQRTVTLRAGDVLSCLEGPRSRGGWRTFRIRHRGGELPLRSSQLPDDEAFARICDRVRKL